MKWNYINITDFLKIFFAFFSLKILFLCFVGKKFSFHEIFWLRLFKTFWPTVQGRGRIKYTNTLKYDPTFKDDNRTLKCEITGLNFGLDGFNQSEFKDFSAVVKLCKPTKFNASHSSIAMPRSDIRIRKVMDRLFNWFRFFKKLVFVACKGPISISVLPNVTKI